MHVLILQQTGRRVGPLQKRLAFENIRSDILNAHNLELDRLFEKINKVHGIIFYIKSPSHKEPLTLLPILTRKIRIPMICIDENDDTATEILVKKYGIEQYFSPPFSLSEIAIQLKMLIYRKMRRSGGNQVRIDDLTLDFISHELRKKNTHVELRGREYALIEFFMLNPRKILPRNFIIEHLWDRNASMVSNSVDVHIARLRRKLETQEKKYFHTIRSIGYKFEPLEVKVKKA